MKIFPFLGFTTDEAMKIPSAISCGIITHSWSTLVDFFFKFTPWCGYGTIIIVIRKHFKFNKISIRLNFNFILLITPPNIEMSL
jgi:hypothetical protein